MKTPLFLSSLLLMSSSVFAQHYAQQLTLNRAVLAGVISEQKAVETILATSPVSQGASALYAAGKSVTLQPGFTAQAGSVFSALITPVVSTGSASDGPGLSIRANPNPFAEQITIEYRLPLSSRVRHTLLDAKGLVVRQSDEPSEQSAGPHQVHLEGSNLPAGIYLYQVQAGSETRTLRLVKKP